MFGRFKLKKLKLKKSCHGVARREGSAAVPLGGRFLTPC
jgi:hypothetical protein